MHARAEHVLRLLLRKLDELPGVRNVVFLSHAATTIALSRALGGDRDFHVKAATCSVSHFSRVRGRERERDGLGAWTRILNGDTSFLERGEEVSFSESWSIPHGLVEIMKYLRLTFIHPDPGLAHLVATLGLLSH